MSAAVCDAHVGLHHDGQAAPAGVLASIDNVPTSPRGGKLYRTGSAAAATLPPRSPATPAQPRAPPSPEAEDFEDPLAPALAEARELLRAPSTTDAAEAPLGREAQHARLVGLVEAFADSGRGEALYVSGLPGTGKSHTVRRALAALDYEGGVTTLWVNCMAVSSAGEVYARIHAALAAATGAGAAAGAPPRTPAGAKRARGAAAGGFAPAAAAGPSSISYEQLIAALAGAASGGGSSAVKRRRASGAAAARGGGGTGRRVAVVLDELDALVGKGQQGVYELFMLPHQPGVRALVVGIANSIDLTERALPALKLRGCTPTLVAFPAYSTAQVVGIITTCLEQLPERLIDKTAIELCARQVASTSGDLRLAIKACRGALDALAVARAQHFAVAAAEAENGCGQAAGKAPPACVGVRDMMAALGRLAGVRSSQHGAATVASIRALPNQQQLLLYSLSVLCPPPEDAAPQSPAAAQGGAAGGGGTPQTAGRGRSAVSLWAELTPGGTHAARPVLVRTPSGSLPAGVGRRLFGAGGGSGKAAAGGGKGAVKGAAAAGGYVLAVPLGAAYAQYCRVCRLVGMAAATCAELKHMADLLAQMALLDVIEGAGGGSAAGTPSGKGGAAASTPGGGRRGPRRGPRGFGAAASAAAGSPAVGGGGGGGGGEVQLSLRVGHDEVQRALAANPALRCLVNDA
ncbi:hypothetical protein Rsub_04274 [Raphidocelis subcapitata]|uniref:Orc1-like AAA ATPase domain-containing protein n=1 Tax=Raphidocelis subcapitata TaxID=307507 RepID=A0A2V0NV72_9CHLO|nr:hypothetical protein Rsub_04274 [Raphidocelis subcapitata]|eukprot:GBF91534.1 hypothetical protein Rsub_04274 [Raphidocelis subcapitata]